MSRRQSVAGPTCRAWLTEDNYAHFTLPTVRARVQAARAAGRAGPGAPRQQTADDGVAALPPVGQYALFPAAVVLIAIVTWRVHRKLRRASLGGPPRDRLWTPP
jgi:hypothetical protein